MEQLLVSLLLSAGGCAMVTLCSLKMLQIYQLSSYQAGGFFRWIKRSRGDYPVRYFSLGFFQFVSLLIFCFSFPKSPLKYIGLILYFALGIYFVVLQFSKKQKTPLKITWRIRRLLVAVAVLNFGLCFVAVYFLYPYAVGHALIAAITVLIPLVVTLAHFVVLPLEKLVAKKFKRRAKKALSGGIVKVGITGSFGKTTVKNILHTLLSQKYKVLTSPASHNTPMGLCKLVNGGVDGYEVFIAEMGARHKGDIAELCDFILPDYGIITAVGAMHLETFGSIDEVVKTKMELAHGCSRNVVLNSDDHRLMDAGAAFAAAGKGEGYFLYSGTDGADASFFDVRVSDSGTSFCLNLRGEKIDINTPLLGRHIPSLFAECAVLAHRMGVSPQQISQAAAQIQPVPHRLQLIKKADCTIIDDAFNSNPQGAKNALEVLSLFGGTKVVVTPGFVELGEIQRQANTDLGAQAAGCADYIFCVGNTDISNGALSAGMDKSRIIEADSLNSAMESLAKLRLENPVILFLNDLPDSY